MLRTPPTQAARAAGKATVRTVGPTQSEFDHRRPGGGMIDTGRLGGHQGLKVDDCQQCRLHELCLGQRPLHCQQRLVGKYRRPLGRRRHSAAETELPQVVDKLAVEYSQPLQIRQFIRQEAQSRQVVQSRLQSGEDRIATFIGGLTKKEIEHGGLCGHAFFQVAGQHRQFVQIRQERWIAHFFPSASSAEEVSPRFTS